MVRFLFASIVFFFLACGYSDGGGYDVIYPDGDQNAPKFDDQAFKDSCFKAGCHNDSAPAIPALGEGFKKSAKVKARIADGSMPPGGAWDAKKRDAALAYLKGEKQDDDYDDDDYDRGPGGY